MDGVKKGETTSTREGKLLLESLPPSAFHARRSLVQSKMSVGMEGLSRE